MAPFHIERATGSLQVARSGCRQDRGPPGPDRNATLPPPTTAPAMTGAAAALQLRDDHERVDVDAGMREWRTEHAHRHPVVPARGPGTRQREVPRPRRARVGADRGHEGSVDVDLRR